MAKETIILKTQIPGPRSMALMHERRTHVARGPFHITPIFVAKAKGAVIEDVDGNHLIDFAGGIGVVNVGHSPDSLVAGIKAQAEQFIHAGFNVTPYESYVRVCEKLNQVTPGDFPKKSFLANSGAEAVENAIKIARAFTGRQAIVCFDHAFHGRTYMAMSLTSKARPYRYGFGPFSPEIYRARFPYTYRWPTSQDPEVVSRECFAQFEELVNTRIGPAQVAAVIIEPVLGEGGFVVAPPQFLKRLRDYCTTHGIVLIADEIQSGFGRTGGFFASEALGFVPDLITTAKGLGGGMPISAVTGRATIMDAPGDGGIGGTFGGNPLSCAAALEVFKIFETENLAARAKKMGIRLHEILMRLHMRFPVIGEVRGLGPMQAMELVKPKTRDPFPEAAKQLMRYCYEHGVILMTAGTYGNVIRILAPLVIEDDQLVEGLKVVEAGLEEIK